MADKILKLQDKIKSMDLNFILVPNTDKFPFEMIAEYARRIFFISGFTGSAGFIIAPKKGKCIFFTDGRYIVQAKNELNLDFFDIVDISETSPFQWLKRNSKKDDVIGVDGSLFTYDQLVKYKSSFKITEMESNIIDELWNDKPKEPYQDIFMYKYTSRPASEKIKYFDEFIKNEDECLLITSPESVSWVLNIRSNNSIKFTPVVLGYVLIQKNKKPVLFANCHKIDDEVITYIDHDPLDNLFYRLSSFKNVYVEKKNIPSNITSYLKDNGINFEFYEDKSVLDRSKKDDIEMEGAISAHVYDGAAVTKFFLWLYRNRDRKDLSELFLSDKLLEFRRENKDFISNSFETISSFAENAAIIHYHPTTNTNMKIDRDGVFLCDSGAQYKNATTDVTRTIFLGNNTNEKLKHHFSLVLKGHIALASAMFPKGTTGPRLDILARQFLWENGLDYKHGTGHGVGSFLSVHEGPHSISQSLNNIALEPNMIVSNEPGFYLEGEYGIRIENLIYVSKCEDKEGFLKFINLTKIPIDPFLISWDLLSDKEISWINNYNQTTLDDIKHLLSEEDINLYRSIYM